MRRAYSSAWASSAVFVQCGQLSIAHHPAAVDHHVSHVVGMAGIHQLGVDPFGSRRKRGALCDRAQVHQDQIGTLARLQ